MPMEDKGQEQEKETLLDQQEILLQLQDVEKKLADLKARWPFHSVQPRMVAEREDLEEERDRLLGILKS
ncbi:hypothetical protein Desaci_3261 [Desulfosporosinus acidiphilus SJ4]|uniref:Uncharacterized protein n=1 Tax=Desulfosporosinus acidiphilus (strain DSM 22704 / JCM 16185 / SJ4) TaxID=646529 RepID=I4D8N4_DESAJ|nr:hypothetical protein [Desulfosporosinus acidiphilus]AFM42158.1 hypothetical protein Desaci_3261 [Desulfosporosinus acidiphilus SJ4]